MTTRRTPSRPWGRRARGEEGTGLIASLAGLLAFLALLLFAVQTLVALHTRSVVTDAAYEGARAVAGARVDHTDPVAVAEAQADASEKVRRLLGRFGEKVELDWSGTTDETVSLTVPSAPAGLPVGGAARAGRGPRGPHGARPGRGAPMSRRPRRRRMRWRDDTGQVGGIEVLPFGLLTFVVGTLLVANAWGVVDAKLAVTSAAREAVRAYVEAPDQASAAAAADDAAVEAVAGHGRNPDATTIEIRHDGDEPFARCTRVTVTVHHPVPAIRLPFIGGYGHAFDVVASQSEVVDPYRSGLPGEASC